MAIMRWRGDEVAAKVIAASKLGVDQTTGAGVVHAKTNHGWKNQTGTAEGSIQMRPAELEGGVIIGLWGSFDVDYFIWLELGTANMAAKPSLRPAADAEYPGLVARIRAGLVTV